MTEVRSQNGWIVISALLANPVAGQAVWGRISESWDAILERFPKNAHARIAEAIPALCGDAGFAAGVVQFLKDHPLASGPRRVAQSVERLGVNVAFADRDAIGWPTAWGRSSPPGDGVSAETGGHTVTPRLRLDDRHRPAPGRRGVGPGTRRRPGGPKDPGFHARRRGRGAAARRLAGRGDACCRGSAPPTFVEIGAWCGKSSLYLGAAAEATGAVAVLHRPPPRLGGEPTRLGVSRSRSRRPRSRSDRHPGPLAARHRRRRPRRSGRGRGGRLPDRGGPLDAPAGVLLHRRRAWRGAGLGRLPGLGAPCRRSGAGWPSTTSSPTPPTVAGHPTSSSAPPWPPASSPRTAPAGACACSAGSAGPPAEAARCGRPSMGATVRSERRAPRRRRRPAQWGSARSSAAGRHSPRNSPAAGVVFERASAASTMAPKV